MHPVDNAIFPMTPDVKRAPEGLVSCSVCWSPLNMEKCRALLLQDEEDQEDRQQNSSSSSGSSSSSSTHGAEEESCGCDENSSSSSSSTAPSSSSSGGGRSVTKTRCGHLFHKRCLLEVKIRKAECPNCRCELTPVSNPQTVPAALEAASLQPSSLRDAVIHAAMRGRNAVRRKMELEERRRAEMVRAEGSSAALEN